MEWKPYTYLIGWSEHDKYYYGSKYGKDAHPKTFWVTYYTSSGIVKEFREQYGEPNICEIRKTFNTIEETTDWEYKVLRRMGVMSSEKWLNKNQSPAMPVYYGADNHAKRPEVRAKLKEAALNRPKHSAEILERMSQTRRKNNLIKWFVSGNHRNLKPTKSKTKIEQLNGYQSILSEHPHPFRRTLKWLQDAIYHCENYKPKPYPNNRKGVKRGKIPAISEAKKGKKWYHNPKTLETRPFYPDQQPDGWKLGMIKNTPNNMTPEVRKKLSKKTTQYRANESDRQKKSRVEKWRKTRMGNTNTSPAATLH